MQAYVDEFTYRLNDGSVGADAPLRLGTLFRIMPGQSITYACLIIG